MLQPDPNSAVTSVPTVPFHTDNGLFLLLTPSAMDKHPLMVKSANNRELIASSNQGDIIVVFGRALEDWLLQSSKGHEEDRFRAGVHAVPEIREDRVVFARMYIAPGVALPVKNVYVKMNETTLSMD